MHCIAHITHILQHIIRCEVLPETAVLLNHAAGNKFSRAFARPSMRTSKPTCRHTKIWPLPKDIRPKDLSRNELWRFSQGPIHSSDVAPERRCPTEGVVHKRVVAIFRRGQVMPG